MTAAIVSACLMTLTAIVHSILGEKRLVGPILRRHDDILAMPLARMVIRFAWHVTSVAMVLNAATVAWPGTPTPLVQLIGAGWLVMGVIDVIWSRGRHIGWPFISAAGIAALIAV